MSDTQICLYINACIQCPFLRLSFLSFQCLSERPQRLAVVPGANGDAGMDGRTDGRETNKKVHLNPFQKKIHLESLTFFKRQIKGQFAEPKREPNLKTGEETEVPVFSKLLAT